MQMRTPLLAILLLGACGTAEDATPPLPPVEAISLLGDSLRQPPLDSATRVRFEAQRDSAAQRLQADSSSADAWVWLGRRTAYLGAYREALATYSEGIARFPDDPRFLRHRGHRWISVREFARAIEDLTRAAAMIAGQPDVVEPDGLPNARNIPTSTLHSNIWYHLGLAHYLKGEWQAALDAYTAEAAIADNPDMLVATTWWHYLTLRRLGEDSAAAALLAPITPDLDVIENQSYHRLLLLARGDLPLGALVGDALASDDAPADAAVAYGIGAWQLVEGQPAAADSTFRQLVATGSWPAFGVIAAEAELAGRP